MLLTPIANSRGSQSPSDLIICYKDSLNSLKAIFLMVIADYGERIQIGYNSQRKRLGAEPRRVTKAKCLLFSSHRADLQSPGTDGG